jgi:Fe-S cluster biogenesis protein NfuA
VEVTDELIVHVRLLGACRSCEMSSMTLRAGVEETIKRDVPEIKGVVALREVNV